jgi:hypothetical protein
VAGGGTYNGTKEHCIDVDWPAAYTWSARQYRVDSRDSRFTTTGSDTTMNSDLAVAAVQILLLSASVVWVLRRARTKLLLALLPMAITVFSLWWLARPGPRDGPPWIIPVFVALFALGTAGIAKLAGTQRPMPHFIVTVLGSVLSILISGLLAYLVWGLSDFF